jgi:hypothetical protein
LAAIFIFDCICHFLQTNSSQVMETYVWFICEVPGWAQIIIWKSSPVVRRHCEEQKVRVRSYHSDSRGSRPEANTHWRLRLL